VTHVTQSAGVGTQLLRAIFGAYAWLAFIVGVLLAFLATLLIPWTGLRHKLAADASRAIFVLAGVWPKIRGLENLPDGRCVVVANHASYVDGILLKGYLPARFSFVIKGEMRNIPVVHFVLRRAGAKFVERFEAAGSSRDARKLVKAAQSGDSLAFFPEGTFQLEPGVRRFRAGAFVSAVKGEMPIVPVAISGTREMLPAGRFWPWPSRIRIDILPPINPDDPAFENHRLLADTARQRILAVLNEPDLLED
jgi:1-acyl-sn-glycerol-3-phosphate acyltransferase